MLGVEKETGFTLNYDKYNWEEHPDHFILADTTKPVDFGEGKKNIFAYEDTEILVQREKEVQMAVHEFGKGRCVYISGLPYSFENSRILYRSILWSTHGEKDLHQWFSSNFNVEVHAYVKNGRFCVVNNTYAARKLWFIVVMAAVFLWRWRQTRLNGITFNTGKRKKCLKSG